MKHAAAIVLFCLPAQLTAGGRCPVAEAHRIEIARALSAKPHRAEVSRPQKIRTPPAWQRPLMFEMQIL
jgi:hypothetical protein